jgi:hypothetical protein
MRYLSAALVAVVLIGGCSSSESDAPATTPPSETVATTSTSTTITATEAPTTTTTQATTTTEPLTPLATTTTSARTTTTTTTTTHTPLWLTVKYRSDPVDVANPWFVYLDGGLSSLVDAAFYDAGNEYMIISLDGTAYHYCGMPSTTWSEFTAASSLGSFYKEQIKGRFDCRIGVVPEY